MCTNAPKLLGDVEKCVGPLGFGEAMGDFCKRKIPYE